MSVKIQFGCGGNRLDGWENFDSEMDIRKPLPFTDNHADFLYASHVMEHINSHEALRFCQECFRVLKRGGVLRLCIPVLERISDRAHAVDLILGHGHEATYSTQVIWDILFAAGFDRSQIVETPKKDIDRHHLVIGIEKDHIETARVEATKI